MARIGLASDSFGNLEALGAAFDLFGRVEVDRVFFMGGWWADVDAVLARRRTGASSRPGAGQASLADRITRVASRSCPEYGSGALGKTVDFLEGHVCCLVHDKSDLSREDIGNASLLFHGKSSRAALTQFGPRIFVTPGQLRAAEVGGAPPTFATVDVTDAELVFVVYAADGVETRRERATFQPGGKVTVR